MAFKRDATEAELPVGVALTRRKGKSFSKFLFQWKNLRFSIFPF